MFYFPDLNNFFFSGLFKFSIAYNNLVKYVFATKIETFIFFLYLTLLDFWNLLNILIVHDNIDIYMNSIRIYSPI